MTRKVRTPDAILRASAETNVAAAVRRLLADFDSATSAMVASGAIWYREAYGVCAGVAIENGLSVETVVAVMAALSPQTPWARNVAGTVHFADTKGGRLPGILTANHARAMRSFTSPDPVEVLTGPKVRAFAANILGDEEQVTIDVWAARRALGVTEVPTDTILDRAGVYGALSHVYRVAAAKRGVTPAVMQAVVWIVARNGRAT